MNAMPNQHPVELLRRHSHNPILSAADWPYPMNSVFNTGAVRLQDGTTLLLCRVEDRTGVSHLCAARSHNGVDGWEIDPAPTMHPDPAQHPEEAWGVEDPRITFVPELGKYVITYTAYSCGGPSVALAVTEDFRRFERYGAIMPPDDKNAALFPRRIGGKWAMLHRPATPLGQNIWLSYSPDLRHWGNHQMILEARQGASWDAQKIGVGVPPIETPEGWLILYHGVRQSASGAVYRIGLALLDLEHPERCLRRGRPWMFRPEEPYEREGDVANVVFPCGFTVAPDGDTLHMYYGAADTVVALATGSIRIMLDWLKEFGSQEGFPNRHAK